MALSNARDKDGKTALDYAKDNGKIYHTEAYQEMKDLINK